MEASMKTINRLILFSLLVVLGGCATAERETNKITENPAEGTVINQFNADDFELEDTVLIKYRGTNRIITIPDQLGIIEIGKEAFADSPVQYITIPPTVKIIESYAFKNCKQLYSVNLPDSVTHIKDHAFFGCSNLNRIKLPESVEDIGIQAFGACPITEILIPASVLNISEYAFGTCSRLSRIIVAKENRNYADIDGVLFDKSTSILVEYPPGKLDREYRIPERVRIINDWAFNGNEFLSILRIPSGVEVISGNYTFANMDLAAFTVDQKNTNFSDIDGVLFSKDHKWLISYPNSKGSAYIVPENVEVISDFAFYFRGRLTNITFPQGLLRIGEYAFCGCSLLDITIPNSVTNIDTAAFNYNDNLTVRLSRTTKMAAGRVFPEKAEIVYYE
jgi:lactocepin